MQNESNVDEMDQGLSPLADSSTIVIVHGAWSSANDWHTTAGQLASVGNRVITVNLPGHGDDETPVAAISLQLYIYETLKAIGDERDVTLVCHSFGGIIGRAVAELIAPQIKKIIYVAAFVPQDGDSLLSIAQTDPESLIGKSLIVDDEAGVVDVAKAAVAEVFMADAPQQVATYVTNNLRPEPLAPLATPVTLAVSSPVEEVYVHTILDRTVSYPLQQKMVKKAGIVRTYSLPASHTPFIAHSPILSAIISFEAR